MDSWYSVLGVRPDATADQITSAVERMMRQANALSVTAPDRARQMRDQVRAIRQDLLAGAERRQWYDTQLAAMTVPPPGPPPASPLPSAPLPAPPPGQVIQPGQGMQQAQRIMSRVTRFLQAGWTCTVCGYGAVPADKFCSKCGNRIHPEPDTGAPQR